MEPDFTPPPVGYVSQGVHLIQLGYKPLYVRIAFRYACCMTQLVARIDHTLAALVDDLVTEGIVESRSDAVRQGLRILIDQHRRRRTAEEIIRGYVEHPQTDEDVAWADDATRRMISEEPW